MILKFLSRELEKAFVLVALRASNGNVHRACVALGISSGTIYHIIKRDRINLSDYGQRNIAPRRKLNRVQKKNQGFYATKFKMIMEALDRNNGSRGQTAKELGISIRSVRNWINEAEDCGFTVTPSSGRGKGK